MPGRLFLAVICTVEPCCVMSHTLSVPRMTFGQKIYMGAGTVLHIFVYGVISPQHYNMLDKLTGLTFLL